MEQQTELSDDNFLYSLPEAFESWTVQQRKNYLFEKTSEKSGYTKDEEIALRNALNRILSDEKTRAALECYPEPDRSNRIVSVFFSMANDEILLEELNQTPKEGRPEWLEETIIQCVQLSAIEWNQRRIQMN